MPLANCTTPANGNETEQVILLLDRVKVKPTNLVDHVKE